MKKCEFYQTEVEYLGFDVGAYGVKLSIAKVKAVAEWPTPESAKDVRSFLGPASFYKKFIHRFSEIIAPFDKPHQKGQSRSLEPRGLDKYRGDSVQTVEDSYGHTTCSTAAQL